MRACIFVNCGFEDIASEEVKTLTRADTTAEPGVVVFDVDSYDDLCKVAYQSRTSSRTVLLLSRDAPKADDFRCVLVLVKDKTFKVDGKAGQDVYPQLGGIILDAVPGSQVDLKNPDVSYYVHIDEHYYFGLDLSGFDTSKRDYKIFPNKESLKASVAYSLVNLSGFGEGKSLLDPFVRDGTIVIEAAQLVLGISPQHHRKQELAFTKLMDYEFSDAQKGTKSKIYAISDQNPNIVAAKKNAKIAGVNKLIEFSRKDLDFVEVKLGENSVDCIATQLPGMRIDTKQQEKIIEEFFYQAEFVLKKGGRIALISRRADFVEDKAKKYKFRLVERRDVWQGKEKRLVFVFQS